MKTAEQADQAWRELFRNIWLGVAGLFLFIGSLIWIGIMTALIGLAVWLPILALTGQL